MNCIPNSVKFYILNNGLPEPHIGATLIKQEKKENELEDVRNAPIVIDHNEAMFGDMSLIQSQYRTLRRWTMLSDINTNLVDNMVWIRARLHSSRIKGKIGFLLLRQTYYTCQGVLEVNENENVLIDMIKYAKTIPIESIVDIYARVKTSSTPIQTATQTDVELIILKIFCVSAASSLPFSVQDVSRSQKEIDESQKSDRPFALVNPETRLDFRWIDVRTAANHAIFQIQSFVCQYYSEFLVRQGFVEIHTPKIISGVSEGGANVFNLKYFNRSCCLAQSPQLYKQMAVMSDINRVFEIAPVFRAEDSNTHRHLTEFIGLDFEMVINEHYHEILEIVGDCFCYIFDHLIRKHQKEMMAINSQYEIIPLQYGKPHLVLHHSDCIKLLRENGENINDLDDFNTPQEKLLGKIIKEKFQTDFYMIDRYPTQTRPFYTMPMASDPQYCNSFDVFLRGEEIISGAQRIHDPLLLQSRAIANNIPISSIQSYIDCFKHGAYPHGGMGAGLERVVMLFLGLNNVRKTCLFPRDPKRCTP